MASSSTEFAPATSFELELQNEVATIIAGLNTVTSAPDSLLKLIDSLRCDMEIPQGEKGKTRNFNPATNWRSMPSRFSKNFSDGRFSSSSGQGQGQGHVQGQGQDKEVKPARPVGRYQSRFTSGGDLDDKILNTIIGNKLNSFTPMTYNYTRDFIYQIMDSGEKEFIKDFIEKVFAKATLEELYCALFAKLIAEIAHRYPIMYDQMRKYHEEFLHIFEDVDEANESSSDNIIKKRQYRLGYGQFISELASLNALEKDQLLAMVEKVMEKIWILSSQNDKVKTVEEFIDCLVRLTKSLREKSLVFFNSVKEELRSRILDKIEKVISKENPRPSLSTKARFGLMDLKDIL